jgi:glutamate N-acetyltransferase/amino-acid N-acetyltransferase
MRDAEAMASTCGALLGVDAAEVLVCSTGTIGVPLPMPKVLAGIDAAAAGLEPDGGGNAARAIMTTDTVPKEVAVETASGGMTIRVGGMAKGSGMIAPDMATMLAFVTTDAAVEQEALQHCLSGAVTQSFNRITVDGDQSTNDTVLLMAGGAAGNEPLDRAHPGWAAFTAAVEHVCRELALSIVRDGEGATKFVTVRVVNAASDEDARMAARAVADSLLVKTSWYGCDPNWGRVMAAVGYSGAEVDPAGIDIHYDDVCAVRSGTSSGEQPGRLTDVLARDEFTLSIDMHLGRGACTVYTCDCSQEYVKINSEYTT